MTGYEVAAELENFMNSVAIQPPMVRFANYIRRQADKIKMLEQECAAMREQLSYLESQIYGGTTK